MSRKEPLERRKHRRFRAKEGAFAAVRPEYAKIGQIVDISRGGLAFRYTVTDSDRNRSYELDIFLVTDDFHISGVPFKTISDVRIPEKFSPGSLDMRRCGVQFGELSQKQLVQLDYFIQNYTIGEA